MKITLDVPEQYLEDEDPAEFARRVWLYAALFMFGSGKLSAGAAAEFAGIDRFTFAAERTRYGIPVVDYDPDDLKAESESLRAAS